jgi:signal transduction histidine kinase
MSRLPAHTAFFLLIDGILFILCALHVPSLIERAQVPFEAVDVGSVVRITGVLDTAACSGVVEGDQLLSFDGRPLVTADALEFLANFHSVGDAVAVTVRHEDGSTAPAVVRMVQFYRMTYRIMVVMVALLTWSLGIFVLLARPRDLSAAFLHASMTSLAVVMISAFEGVTPGSLTGFVSSMLFFLSYVSVATTFYFFTTLFPNRLPGSLVVRALALYIPSAVLATGLGVTYWRALADRSVERFLTYNVWYDVLHLWVLLLVGGGIVNIIRSYARATTHEERRKLQWVLWGLCVGPTPFLVLNIIPELFRPTGLVHEEYTLIFMAFIPASFAISVVRHRLFDIEQVIQRTAAYVVILIVLLGLYVGSVTLVASFVGQMVAGVGGAILVGLLFEPVRIRVQREVDKRFFRIRYSFREAQARFMDEVKTCMDERSVATLTVDQIATFIPVERLGFCLYLPPENRLLLLAQFGFALPDRATIPLASGSPLASQQRPIALDDAVEPGVVHESADKAAFARWGISLLVPLLSGASAVQGLLVLGRKKSGARFTPDDMGLLLVFAGEAGVALNRIRLQKELFEKQAESQRLEELSELKSDFVSYVSHELRTPLTSIKMFTQLLRDREGRSGGKAREYLQIIEGETDRLGRMVSTILDAARIDQGRKEYHFAPVDLGDIGQKVMELMKYQLDMERFSIRFKRPARPVYVDADADAVADAIINLIGNSIKYSAETKWLAVKVSKGAGRALCSVEDHGVGISPEAIPHLFEKFYREPGRTSRVQGVGLGLSVVKHTMDAHRGTITVHSVPGRGTTFVLDFPLFSSKQSVIPEGNHQ